MKITIEERIITWNFSSWEFPSISIRQQKELAKDYEIEINDTNTNSNQRPQETKIIKDWKWRKQLCQMKK